MWMPLERAERITPDKAKMRAMARQTGKSLALVRKAYNEAAAEEHWLNEVYQVSVAPADPESGIVRLSIKRRDRQPIHDWRDLQRIKNQLLGPECEAIELYPAESRKVDTANQYFLFGFREPRFRFPVGFHERMIVDGDGELTEAMTRQRPIEPVDQ